MSNVNVVLKETMTIDGAIAAALVDYTTGMTLGTAGDSSFNLDVAAAGTTEVVRAQMRMMEGLHLQDRIEDILITIGSQYHLTRVVDGHDGLFLYLVLNRSRANLGMARFRLASVEKDIVL